MGSTMRQSFPAKFAKYVDVLCNNSNFGICKGSVRVSDVKSGCPTYTKHPCGDRFKVTIPYAGQSLTWEVILNVAYPDEPPDFIFDQEDSEFVPDFEKMPSYMNWDPRNAHSLLAVVQELYEEYKKYQYSLIKANSRLMWEYSSLIETEFHEEDIEIHTSTKPGSRQSHVNFLMKLPVDFSDIPAYLVQDNPGEDSAIMLVKFSADASRINPQLFLSPRVENCFGGSANLSMPTFPSGACLVDYVPGVLELLRNQVEQIVQGYQRRREYISAFLAIFGKSVMEYDTEGFSSISLLLEYLDFHFALHIALPMFFPIEQPVFVFQSVYRENYKKVVDDYPYSPRWSGNEMAERAKDYILDFIAKFQRDSVKGFSL